MGSFMVKMNEMGSFMMKMLNEYRLRVEHKHWRRYGYNFPDRVKCAILGDDDAGKTTLFNSLIGQSQTAQLFKSLWGDHDWREGDALCTIGDFKWRFYDITCMPYGADWVRTTRYEYDKSEAIIYLVDASRPDLFEKSRRNLCRIQTNLLEEDYREHTKEDNDPIPILVLGTKIDIVGAVGEYELGNALGILSFNRPAILGAMNAALSPSSAEEDEMIEIIMGFLLFNDHDLPYRDAVKLQMCSLKENFGVKPGVEWLQEQFVERPNMILLAYEIFPWVVIVMIYSCVFTVLWMILRIFTSFIFRQLETSYLFGGLFIIPIMVYFLS